MKKKTDYQVYVVEPAKRLAELLLLLEHGSNAFDHVRAWAIIDSDGQFSCALDNKASANDCLSSGEDEKVVEVTICIPKKRKK